MHFKQFTILKSLESHAGESLSLGMDSKRKEKVLIKRFNGASIHGDSAKGNKIQPVGNLTELKHPYINRIYEIGEESGRPYIIFQYVKGMSVRDHIRRKGKLELHQAMELMQSITRAVNSIHKKSIVHGRLDASKVILKEDRIPVIMDLGVFYLNSGSTGLKPEMVSSQEQSDDRAATYLDILSLGELFYEMLTACPIQRDNGARSVAASGGKLDPPSHINDQADELIDEIVMKALNRKRGERFSSVEQLEKELTEYSRKRSVGKKGSKSQAVDESEENLERLMRRINFEKHFPGFVKSIVQINQHVFQAEEKFISASQLANVILKDYSLTTKLLKLVNSAFYGQFSGKIATISRAVVVLGFENVRMAAASLILFDHLRDKKSVVDLQDTAMQCFMSGIIAGDVAESQKLNIKEKVFICAMLYNLGKLVIIFYLPDEYEKIKKKTSGGKVKENFAARAVLGVSYEELGKAVLKAWRFPDMITEATSRLRGGEVDKPASELDALKTVTNFSNELCDIIQNKTGSAKDDALLNLRNRFEKSIQISDGEIRELIDSSTEKLKEYSHIMNIDVKQSRFIKRLNSDPSVLESVDEATEEEKEKIAKKPAEKQPDEKIKPETQEEGQLKGLLSGIQEITNILMDDFDLNDVMIMILETIFRGFRFDRVVFCMLDASRTRMKARLGYGNDVDRVIKKFIFDIEGKRDIFNKAVIQRKDYFIKDADDPEIRKDIPLWYKRSINAPSFILYPLVVRDVPVGLFYADLQQKNYKISDSLLSYLKTLRNQASIAIKHSVG